LFASQKYLWHTSSSLTVVQQARFADELRGRVICKKPRKIFLEFGCCNHVSCNSKAVP